jgi:hypothetical protein
MASITAIPAKPMPPTSHATCSSRRSTRRRYPEWVAAASPERGIRHCVALLVR